MMSSVVNPNELRSLNFHIVDLERERAEAGDRVRLLVAVQEALVRISMTRTPEDVIATMLRAIRDPLGFSRAIYFGVDRTNGIHAEFQIDGSDTVEASYERADVGDGSAIVDVLRNEAAERIGLAGELSAPLVDVRGWYALATLTGSEGTFGVIYVDGHRDPRPRAFESSLVRTLATIASVSVENSALFMKTQELAMRDPLTGLFNRRAFSERLLGEIERCNANGGSLTYVLIDIDDFKQINDTGGHAYGDRVLKKLAETLLRSSRT